MSDGDRSRREILARIDAALSGAPAAEAPAGPSYRTLGNLERKAVLAEFLERVGEYGVAARTVTATELPSAIAASLEAHSARRVVVPADLPESWLGDGFEWLPDLDLPNSTLDGADGVLTGCALAVAQTGTVVLDAGARQGRRAISLLPDYHLCVVESSQVVDLVPEAISALGEEARRRPITFVSGPSATSDIELSRVEGVHGPRTLEILLVVTQQQG